LPIADLCFGLAVFGLGLCR